MKKGEPRELVDWTKHTKTLARKCRLRGLNDPELLREIGVCLYNHVSQSCDPYHAIATVAAPEIRALVQGFMKAYYKNDSQVLWHIEMEYRPQGVRILHCPRGLKGTIVLLLDLVQDERRQGRMIEYLRGARLQVHQAWTIQGGPSRIVLGDNNFSLHTLFSGKRGRPWIPPPED
jgi:hypothetical protein